MAVGGVFATHGIRQENLEFPQEENFARSPKGQQAPEGVGHTERYLDSRGSGHTDTWKETQTQQKNQNVFDLGSGGPLALLDLLPEGVRLKITRVLEP